MERTAHIKFSVSNAESQSYSMSDLEKTTRVEIGEGHIELMASTKPLIERTTEHLPVSLSVRALKVSLLQDSLHEKDALYTMELKVPGTDTCHNTLPH